MRGCQRTPSHVRLSSHYKARMTLMLIVPAYNEEERLPRFLEARDTVRTHGEPPRP